MIRKIHSFGRSRENERVLRRGFAESTPSVGVAEEGCLLTPSEGVKKKRLSGEVQDGATAARG